MARIIIRLPDLDDMKGLFKRPLQAAAVAAVSTIQRRTARGIDANGSPFRPYTPAYAEKKRESGRSASPPDLTLTGQMVRSLKVKSATNSGAAHAILSHRVLIGVEGQHRDSKFVRNEKAFDIVISSSRDTRTRRNKDGTTTTYRQVADKYRRNKSTAKGFKLKRLPTTTPLAVIVNATHRRRPWFAVRTRSELAHLVRVFQRALDREVARRNERARKALPPARRTA